MPLYLRPPSGPVLEVDDSNGIAEFRFRSRQECSGQWLIFHSGGESALVAGIHDGTSMERLGGTFVFNARLDESGEIFLAVLRSVGLLTVRLILSTSKLTIESYYGLLASYSEIFSSPMPGPAVVAGAKSSEEEGRRAVHNEMAFELIQRSFDVLKQVPMIRSDLSRHRRGAMGASGVDAIKTLESWRKHRGWYRAQSVDSKHAVHVGGGAFVQALRTEPKKSLGGNLMIGALIWRLSELNRNMGRGNEQRIANYLLKTAAGAISKLDFPCTPNAKLAMELLREEPSKSPTGKLISDLDHIGDVMDRKSSARVSHDGDMPFTLPPTAKVFQDLCVSAALITLGARKENVPELISRAREIEGANFNGYDLWVDSALHPLTGWRDQSGAPSGYRPDILINRKSDNRWLLLDAKLRGGNSEAGLLSQSGIKDLQAYMQEYGLKRSVMMVPTNNAKIWQSEDVEGDIYMIRSICLPWSRVTSEGGELEELLQPMWTEEVVFA